MVPFKKFGCVLAVLYGTLQAGEGSIEITGMGEASSPPQYVEIRVAMTSLCYDRSTEAKEANALLANGILEIMKKFIRTERDKIYATGGQNIRQSEIFYLPSGGSKVICERKWRATNSLSLQTAAISDIPEIQDEILLAIDKAEGMDPSKTAQTYAELMQPNFYLYPEKQTELQKLSQSRAWDDAQDQLDVFKEKCKFQKTQLKSISEPSHSYYPRPTNSVVKEVSTETPVLPENILVRAIWKFLWSFEQSSHCYL